jgi:putative phosphoribosyl transferase
MFQDRESAGYVLAGRLEGYRGDPSALILALPRGGVAVGYTMSLVLRLPLNVFVTRKLRAPENPECALGALSETGNVFLNPEAMDYYAGTDLKSYMEEEIRIQQHEIARRQQLYREGRPLPELANRTVLLVDDGIATSATFLASVDALRKLGLKRLVAAIPVGPPETLWEVRRKVDELVVLSQPEPFIAVGNHYRNFAQLEDGEVVDYLKAAEKAFKRPAAEESGRLGVRGGG